MKKLWCVICFLFFISPVYAQSGFETTFEFKPEIVENQIEIKVGFRGENAIIIEGLLSYNPSLLTLLDAKGESGFTVTRGTPTKEDNFSTVKILADANQDETGISYVSFIFLLSNDFILGTETPVFFHNINALRSNETEFTDKGQEIIIRRYSVNKMKYENEKITNFTKTKYWILDHVLLLIGGGILFIILVVSLVSLWVKKQTAKVNERMEREEEERNALSNSESLSEESLNKNRDFILESQNNNELEQNSSIRVKEEVSSSGDETMLNQHWEEEQTSILSNVSIPLKEQQTSIEEQSSKENALSFETSFNPISIPDCSQESIDETIELMPINENDMPSLEEISQGEEYTKVLDNNLEEPLGNFGNLEEEKRVVPSLEEHSFVFIDEKTEEENQNKRSAFLNQSFIASSQENEAILDETSLEETQVLEPINIQESIDPFQMTPDNTKSKEDAGSTNPNFPFVLILLFLISSFFCILPVKAEEYRVSDLRNALVGNVPMEETFDYNRDGVVDLKDLLATKK